MSWVLPHPRPPLNVSRPQASPLMTGTEIYKRTPTSEQKAREIRLLAPHWKLLLAFDGVRTLSEVAIAAEMSFADSLPLTQKFLDESWIEEQPITLEQYLKRVNLPSASASTAVAPPTVLHEPKPATPPSPTPAPTPAPSPSPTPVAHPPPPLPAAVAQKPAPIEPSFVITPQPVPSAPASKTPRVMKLSAVVDFITSLVGNISIGQLLVYRVFLRVPPELLMAEDVASVYLVKDTSLIKTEALQKAIADAVNAVAKRALPDSVFAPA